MINNRGVSGSEFHTNQILAAIRGVEIPRAISPSTVDEESLSQPQTLMIMSDEEKEVESDSDFSANVDITSELGVIID